MSRTLIQASILLAGARGNPSTVVKAAAVIYKVDAEAIAAKVKQEFAAKDKAKRTSQPSKKLAKTAA